MALTKVSKKMMNRLSIYLDYLKSQPEQMENISATVMARALGLGEVQVRKDLAKISQTGRKRTGRNREQLIREIACYLEFATDTGTIIVGSGELGQALLNNDGLEGTGLNVIAGFDLLPSAKISDTGKPIYPMNRLESFCRCYDVHVGIITVPAESAQTVCDCLVACGIRAIWNLAPVQLRVPEHVVLQSKKLTTLSASQLMQL